MNIEITELTDENREWACTLLEERWGSTTVVSRGKVHKADTLSGFVAFIDGANRGLVTYRISQKECEVVTLDSLGEGLGIGSALLDAVHTVAKSLGCLRIWLITTNDNTSALRFYQRKGFELVAVHCNAIAESRRLKPTIPAIGIDGIPIRDEIELEYRFR